MHPRLQKGPDLCRDTVIVYFNQSYSPCTSPTAGHTCARVRAFLKEAFLTQRRHLCPHPSTHISAVPLQMEKHLRSCPISACQPLDKYLSAT